jgi:hypothetical protein
MQLRKRERHELETYDEYARVVVRLDARTRVIECRDGVQWIVQRIHGTRNGGCEWEGVSFCRTKEALLRCAVLIQASNNFHFFSSCLLQVSLLQQAPGPDFLDNGLARKWASR